MDAMRVRGLGRAHAGSHAHRTQMRHRPQAQTRLLPYVHLS